MSKVTAEGNTQATSENFEFDALHAAGNYRRSLLNEFRSHLRGNVLEVGGGIGRSTRELATLPDVTAIAAIEPDARFYELLVNQSIEARCFLSTVTDLDPSLSYDGIVSGNVLEHIENDLGEWKSFKRRLRPGGRLCHFVPACPSIYAPMDHSFGHFRRYRRIELKRLLEKAGFRIVQLYHFNSLGYVAWWIYFCLF